MPAGEPTPAQHVWYSQQFRRCNKADCRACVQGGPGHGPYWYAYWRENGRRRSRYIGKDLPPAARPSQMPVAAPAVSLPNAGYAPLRVRTLGGFAVWRGATPLPAAAWSSQMVAGLFKCLLSAPRHRLPMAQIAEMLRPEAEARARIRYLRTTVQRLRRVLGQEEGAPAYVRLDGDLLVLVPAPDGAQPDDWLDAIVFERAAAAALARRDVTLCRAALALYGGNYLPEDPYAEWATARRESLRQQYLALLLQLAALREAEGVVGEAARCLRTALAVDPYHEAAAQALMRVQVAAGRSIDAVRTYQHLAEALRRDLDLAPDVDTEAQYQAVLAARHPVAARCWNLPTLPTSFLGREQEVAALEQALTGRPAAAAPQCRLLTLTGAGGCGKTRLAVELGHEVRSRYPEGLWFVELAALEAAREADPEAIARQTGETLGVRPNPGQEMLEALVTYLRWRRALLILDNCEHLMGGSALFVAALLRECRGVQILTTSREALGVLGETVFRLPSLAVPARRDDLRVQDVSHHAGVRLLVERARMVRPDFAVTPDNCRAVAEICTQLDGIPLAIELAAARLAQFSAGDLAGRLQDRFQVLSTGNRTSLSRHQTLRAVMDWSYRLLNSPERRLLRALSVFSGGWTLDAAEAVCAASAPEDAGVPAVLARLVGKSLVHYEDAVDGSIRYTLLETVRQYAAAQLRVHGEEEGQHARHAHWCLELAERAAAALSGPEQRSWLDRLELEHDNLRAALACCTRERGDAAAGLRLAGALWLFWSYRGHWTEGRQWLSAALAHPSNDQGARLRALRARAALAENQGDVREARDTQEECLALARACRNEAEVTNALNGLGNIARSQHNLAEAATLYQETLALARRAGDTRGLGRALHNLALIAQEQCDYQRAIALNDDAIAHRRVLGDRLALASTLYNQAICYRLAGDLERAEAMFAGLLPQFEEAGDRWSLAAVHNELGRIACERGLYAGGATHLDASLREFRALGDAAALIDVLENWALAVAGNGDPALAARLLGAIDAAHASADHPLPPGMRGVFMSDVARVRHLLGDDSFAANWAAGRATALQTAIAGVLAGSSEHDPTGP